MKSITVNCNAKINLALDVTGKRSDGYHEVQLIFCEIPLFDTLTVALTNNGEIHLECDDITLPTDSGNIAYRAAEKFFAYTKSGFGADIRLEKRIPHGAGLGGGSSDAAGVLKCLNSLLENPLTQDELIKIGATLGADVPFFIIGGCALGEGIGEKLTPLPSIDGVCYVLAKPKESISTAFVYQNLNLNNRPENLCIPAVVDGIVRGDKKMVFENCANILESVTIKEVPVINDIKACLSSSGASLSLMSGSGTSVFGIFEDCDAASLAAESVRKYTDDVYLII